MAFPWMALAGAIMGKVASKQQSRDEADARTLAQARQYYGRDPGPLPKSTNPWGAALAGGMAGFQSDQASSLARAQDNTEEAKARYYEPIAARNEAEAAALAGKKDVAPYSPQGSPIDEMPEVKAQIPGALDTGRGTYQLHSENDISGIKIYPESSRFNRFEADRAMKWMNRGQ